MKRLWPRNAEFDAIASAFPWGRDPCGVGDDAAVVGRSGLLCCDALAEGVHFRRDWSTFRDVGWKAVAQNVADVYAMGGIPGEAVWSVGLGSDWTVSDFRDLARGAREAGRRFGVEIVGGDTVRARGPGFVSLTLSGRLEGKPWLRSGARVGDRLVLAGTLGLSAAGLALLLKGAPSGSPREPLARHRRPVPPRAIVEALRRSRVPVHAAIDISDGLSSECHHLADASGKGLAVFLDCLPRHPALARAASLTGGSVEEWLLHGGEEHSLLLSVGRTAILPEGCVVIGEVQAGQGVHLERSGKREPLRSGGWSHT